MAKFQFEHLSVLANKLNRMPINYRDHAGREYTTFYTTVEFLNNLYHNIGVNDSMERSLRDLKDSCLKELGFKHIATFIDKLTGESIAILGV